MHALIIEDDALSAMLMEDELRDNGFTSCDTAPTEEDAITSVAIRWPDLVISDGSLLGGSGISAVKRIRDSAQVPVIFVTGDPENARRHMPGTPVIGKPFSIYELARAIEQTGVVVR
jgi:DNA-binding response OmpR family regulator